MSVDFRGLTLEAALRALGDSIGISFAYTPSVVRSADAVRLQANGITVAALLTELLVDSNVDVVFSPDGKAMLVNHQSPSRPQVGSVSGRVSEAPSGQPVPGVQIVVSGTSLGSVTDDSGQYRIVGIPAGRHSISARRLGYAPMTKQLVVADESSRTLDFVLMHNATLLEEVVTTVTGAQRRAEVGNSIASLRADSIVREAPISNISDLLASRVPGAVVSAQNGLTGTVSPIRIRGLGSFTLQNDPIVIVDGIRIESSASGQGTGGNSNGSARLGDLDLGEVESVEVVKGPSAATLYGTNAANGVVVIRTKHGQPGALRWESYGELGTMRMDTGIFPTAYRAWGHNPTTGALVAPCSLLSVAAGSCKQDSLTTFSPFADPSTTIFSPGHHNETGLQASGGDDRFRYMFSGAYVNELGYTQMPPVFQTQILSTEGLPSIPDWQLRPNALSRVNFRANLSTDLGSHGNLTFSNGLITQSFRQTSTTPYLAGAYTQGYNDPTSHGYQGLQIGYNFQARTADAVTRDISGLAANYFPTNWLSTRATVGLDYSHDVVDNLQIAGQGAPGTIGSRRFGSNDVAQYTIDAGATATKTLMSLTSKTSVGVQYNRRSQQSGLESGSGLPPGSETITGAATVTTSELHADAIVAGAYVEQEIGWRDRLFVTGAVRADGASTFGQDLHSAAYPKLGVSWLASQEPRFPKIPGVSSLRLRAAFGASGVQPPSTATVSTVSLTNASVNGTTVSAVLPGSIGNPHVGPERQRELEGGLDVEGWSGRVHAEFTFYSRKSTDALVSVPLEASAGGGSIYENVGSVANRGAEGLVNVRLIDARLVAFDLTLNGSANSNKLVTAYPNAPTVFQSQGFFTQRNRVGYPLYGSWSQPILSFADKNGNGIIEPTEVVVGDTEVYVGSSIPTKNLAYGGTLTLWRDRVRINTLFDWHGGYQRFDYVGFNNCATFSTCPGTVTAGSGTFAEQAGVAAYRKASTIYGFIGDGSYTRLREVTITAKLPEWFMRSRAPSITLAGRNLFLWTKWKGGDPEVNSNVGTDVYATPGAPPAARLFTVRVNLAY
jgi:TonB-linked SusC/RagA family outer membrane protein